VILLYDNDEKIAPGAATTLVQRGYDNVFMLSGGKHSTSFIASSCLDFFGFICLCFHCLVLYVHAMHVVLLVTL